MRALVALVAVAALVACTDPADVPPPGPTTAPPARAKPTEAVGSARPFEASVTKLSPALARRMTGGSWRPGCPVPLADLRLVTVGYWGFDGAPHRGELIVRRDLAGRIVRVFRALYQARFPIRAMVPVDAYGGSDDASMAADNTSAFNCRYVPFTSTWSNHAYGRAIDINPVENPYLVLGRVLPPAGQAFLDRRDLRPGMVVAGDAVTRAFAAEGFRWGGTFADPDYQHFDLR